MTQSEHDLPRDLLWLGDAKAETNSPTGDQDKELNPEQRYDEP